MYLPALSRPAIVIAILFTVSQGAAIHPQNDRIKCRKTEVAVLGAGISGITAAQALANASVDDFVIVERNDHIGGRVAHTNFGTDPNGSPYTVELGANWIQGLAVPGGAENPIWRLVKKHGVNNTLSNFSSLLTYDEKGPAEYLQLFEDYSAAQSAASQTAAKLMINNLQDMSGRAGLSLGEWRPGNNMKAQAVEWSQWDLETISPPEQSSLLFGAASDNATYNRYGDDNSLSTDQRGFNAFIIGEAKEFLSENDSRLLLNTTVSSIEYSDNGVRVILNEDNNECIEAEYAICTFSLGVLQSQVVDFKPDLPDWKREAIESFRMGTYTKIFLQFNETFWDPDTEYFLYADPNTRGWYPIFQSLSAPGFFEGSNIVFVTVLGPQSAHVENQSDEETKDEILAVLRSMFPDAHVPEPTSIMYPRWSKEE